MEDNYVYNRDEVIMGVQDEEAVKKIFQISGTIFREGLRSWQYRF